MNFTPALTRPDLSPTPADGTTGQSGRGVAVGAGGADAGSVCACRSATSSSPGDGAGVGTASGGPAGGSEDPAGWRGEGVGPVPVADGVAPTRQQAVGMDWSGGRDAAAVGQLLAACGEVDAARVRQLDALVRVVQSGAAETVVGVAVEVVLAQSGRTTRQETFRLLKAARVLAAMPALRQAFRSGWVSWSQVDAITWTVTALPVGRWAELDTLVADTAAGQVDVEADSLVTDIEWAAATITAELTRQRRRTPVEANRTVWQPRLDGSGDLHASYDAARFPIMVERIDRLARDLEPHPRPGGDGGTDHDHDPHGDGTDGDGDGGGVSDVGLTDAHRHAAAVAGRNAARRAAALFELVTGWHHDTLHPLTHDNDSDDRGDCTSRAAGADGAGGAGGAGRAGRPAVIMTTDLAGLVDGTTPAWLLNRVAGRMRVTADVARRWIDIHGADVRLVVMDDGQPVGVGRRTRIPPGWLRDAVIARDLHDTAPASTTPALLCDLDHTTPWDPADPNSGGATDVDNLAVVSRRWHTRKTRATVTLQRHPDGSATWTATTSGYRIHTAPPPHLRRSPHRPAAWRRLDDIPPPDHPHNHPKPASHGGPHDQSGNKPGSHGRPHDDPTGHDRAPP